MRSILIAASLALLPATGALAESHEEPLDIEATEDSSTMAPAQYNVWQCEAYPTGSRFYFGDAPLFSGYSQIFAAGSGSGQQARITAYYRAIQACRWSTGAGCFARIEECQVQRFNTRY